MGTIDLTNEIINAEEGSRGQRHILLIDDEDFLVKLWRSVLEKRGFQVTSYTEGKLALEEFKENPYNFDIVVTDQSMPFITGVELARELKKIREDIKIVLCTGYALEIGVDTGICETLLKPFDNKKLIEVIQKNL